MAAQHDDRSSQLATWAAENAVYAETAEAPATRADTDFQLSAHDTFTQECARDYSWLGGVLSSVGLTARRGPPARPRRLAVQTDVALVSFKALGREILARKYAPPRQTG